MSGSFSCEPQQLMLVRLDVTIEVLLYWDLSEMSTTTKIWQRCAQRVSTSAAVWSYPVWYLLMISLVALHKMLLIFLYLCTLLLVSEFLVFLTRQVCRNGFYLQGHLMTRQTTFHLKSWKQSLNRAPYWIKVCQLYFSWNNTSDVIYLPKIMVFFVFALLRFLKFQEIRDAHL